MFSDLLIEKKIIYDLQEANFKSVFILKIVKFTILSILRKNIIISIEKSLYLIYYYNLSSADFFLFVYFKDQLKSWSFRERTSLYETIFPIIQRKRKANFLTNWIIGASGFLLMKDYISKNKQLLLFSFLEF